MIQITREKSPSDEGIKIPYFFHVNEFFLESEDSFQKKSIWNLHLSQVLGTDKGFIDFCINIKIKHLSSYSGGQFDSSSY